MALLTQRVTRAWRRCRAASVDDGRRGKLERQLWFECLERSRSQATTIPATLP